MKRIIYILTGIVLLSLSSCSDFLEPKSQSEYVPKDANALQEMLIGSAYPKQDKSNFLLPFLSFLDDDIQFHKTDYEFSINSLTYIIHSGFISGYQNRYGDNLKPPTNVYHRMTA